MKKFLFLFALLSTLTASAYDAEIDGIYYKLNNSMNRAIVASGDIKYTGSVTIPATVTYNGITYNVTLIGDNAFDGCDGLTSVIIPNSVTELGYWAFRNCSGLTSVIIPDSVRSIGQGTFQGCSGMTGVTIGSSVFYIGMYAFQGCSGLKEVIIPNSVTSIINNAFADCSSLTSVISDISSPDGLYNDVFKDISPNCVLTVPYNRKDSYIAKGWTTSIFKGGIKENVIVDDGIYYSLIRSTEQATVIPCETKYTGSVKIPEKVESEGVTYSVIEIGRSAFEDCSDLTSVTIGNNVAEIGWSAFEGCSGLTSVTIGNSVTEIGWDAFYGCPSLTFVSVEKGNTVYDSRDNCNAIIETSTNTLIFGCKKTVIPNSVTEIGACAFWECSSLTYVTIPNNVTKIGDYAFFDCI